MAITPMHAILNYLYRLAEIETTIALRAVRLDPGLGILHTDKRNRDSMTLDCLEAIRPQIDAYALDLLDTRVFTRRDFVELPDGVCRLLPPFSHELGKSLPRWRKTTAPVAEQIANILRPVNTIGMRKDRTPLTKQTAMQSRARVAIARRTSVGGIDEQHHPTMQLPTTTGGRHREQWFADLYPAVRRGSTARLAAATGLTTRYIRHIKRGTYVPDPRHWATIRHIVDNG